MYISHKSGISSLSLKNNTFPEIPKVISITEDLSPELFPTSALTKQVRLQKQDRKDL